MLIFSTLTQRILTQLKEELNDRTEKYYQTFAIDLHHTANINDGSYSAEYKTTRNSSPGLITACLVFFLV